jgi:hypothetical protein
VGRKINPMIIEGQMAGGLAQGIGGALLEEFVYNADGQPLATSFMDYLLPTAMEVPTGQFISTEDFPTPLNPLGVKGAGEGGITAAGGALANAVSNALDVEVTKLPLRPDYLLELIVKTFVSDDVDGRFLKHSGCQVWRSHRREQLERFELLNGLNHGYHKMLTCMLMFIREGCFTEVVKERRFYNR